MTVGPSLWRVVLGPEFKDWGTRFARILKLPLVAPSAPVQDGESRIFLSAFETDAPATDTPTFLGTPLAEGLPRSGWRPLRLFADRFWFHPEAADVIYDVPRGRLPLRAVVTMINVCFPLLQDLVLRGGFPLHAALVARGRAGFALAATGGTGKSTCSRRIPPPWRALCDDTLLLRPGERGAFEAHPFPTWSDYLWTRSRKTWDLSSHVPFRAVFFVRQARKDRVTPIGQGEAAIYLSRSSSEILTPFIRQLDPGTARDLKARIFENACRVARSARAFVLEVSLTGRFWEEMERVLQERS